MLNDINIILIGFMGSGKTSVGNRLSGQTGYRFIDIDAEIEANTGESIPHIFTTYGESYFRSLESGVLRKVCLVKRAVIATGGGVIKQSGNAEVLRRSGLVFYLRWPAEDLYGHVKGSTNRPLLYVPEPLDEIKKLLSEREPLYLSTAHIVIECAGKSIASIADETETRYIKETEAHHIEELGGNSRG